MGGTPYSSRILHVVEVEVMATGEIIEEDSRSIVVSKSRDEMPALVVRFFGASESSVDGDGGGENVTGEGKDRNMFPPDSQILDKRRFRSKVKFKPDRSKIGR